MTKSKFIRFFLINLFLIALFIPGYGQGLIIKGIVTSEQGETLPGVNVVVQGTTSGTVTGIDGNYSLNVPNPAEDVLMFSFIGFETQYIQVAGKTNIDVVMETSYNELDEVIAIGYGTVRKRDLTGSVASADVAELAKAPVSNLAEALNGRVSGVQVQTTEGAPGAEVKIRVRGGGSITQSNEPLYIIDGFPTEGGLSLLDPSEIESIDVLKDASSTAIYGARGANGVILITTKGGKVGKTRVNYDAYFGVKQLAKKLDVLSPYEFVLLDYERNLGDASVMESWFNRYGSFADIQSNYANRPGIDWQDEVFGSPVNNQYHKVSISGGTENTKYNLSYSVNDDQGIMVNSGFKRNSANFNFDHKVSEKLKASASIRYTDQTFYGMGTSSQGSRFNKLEHIVRYRPTIGIKGSDEDLVNLDEDPIYLDDSGNVMQNPLASAEAEHKETETRVLSMNAKLDYNLFKGLTYTLTLGMRTSDQRREIFNGARSVTAKRSGGPSGSLRHTDRRGYSYSNVLNYNKRIQKKHKINLMVGQEEVYNEGRWFEASSNQFPNDDIGLADLSLGTLPGIPASYEEDDRLLSFFGRANYAYQDKYLFTATMRADGSTKFGSGNKYGYFPSASIAWRAVEEEFIKSLDLFSNLKFRLSYGIAGNNRIPNYQSLALLGSDYYAIQNTPQISVASTVLPNPDLKWETTVSRNFGVDLGFLDQRIQLTAEAYQTNTKDLLLRAQIPLTSGYSSMILNVGETRNKGFELNLNTVNVSSRNFEWRTNFNISFNKNKVVALTDGSDSFLYASDWGLVGNDYIVKVGEQIGSMYGYQTDGLFQVEDFNYDAATGKYTLKEGIPYDPNWYPEPGFWKIKDISGPDGEPDGIIDPNDRSIIGNASPIHYGGITNSFSYKNFDLSVFLNWSYGNDIYNANKINYTNYSGPSKNTLANVKDRWISIDGNGNRVTDPTILAELNKGAIMPVYNGSGANNMLHSWGIEDGSFLRINNVSLGYTLPKSVLTKLSISNLRVYTTVYNIHTFTNYSGYDPEVSTRESSGVTPGVDFGAYPKSRSIVFGVNLSL
ncbi:TonB-linked outer membrane protein, SusC/RagA family [Mariniphaga anaerophila]|uniref:TonB-linked outer membrane protein, SusC/RagA family n=1 Tax=Mariniphaga anaerophila TaxID=1484053 RepID=A0A1M4WL44_9BACT|nr:TonB-dependent receptor [Mariniphaga anaerophila]SHE81914.1 TonB-linked outer membrane protein, SusC/RagA family [Mariniphaga anaerophila]